MANLQVSLVTKSYGSKKLFEDVTVNLTAGKRYGLTGPNGAGKSTFMKILAGDLEPDTGSVARPEKTSVLRQDQFGYEDVRVLDVVLRGAKRLWAATTEKEKILALPNIGDEDGHRLGELECVIAEEDGYSAEADAATLLAGLGIPADGFDGPMRELAGGLRLRVLLAQALFGKPDVLLLDEPTNNLDLDSIRWLEGFLCEYEGVLVTVSHDRYFLNAICTHIADIDYNTIITYTGNYDDMVLAKSQVRGRVEAENDDRRKKIAQLSRRQHSEGHHCRSVSALVRRLRLRAGHSRPARAARRCGCSCGEGGISDGQLPFGAQAASVTLGEIADACAPHGHTRGPAIPDVAAMLDRVRLRWLRYGDTVALRRALLAIATLVSVMSWSSAITDDVAPPLCGLA